MKTIQVLDHGYVKFVEAWGSDERIVESARMSTSKGFLGWGHECARCCGAGTINSITDQGRGPPCDKCKGTGQIKGDEKLLRYLYENKHSTPFEFAGLVIEVQAPIFVFREWHRHRTQGYAEMSARYSPLPDVNYVPTVERLMSGGGHLTKQAGAVAGSVALTVEAAEAFRLGLKNEYARQEAFYQEALAHGVPKELARIDLPVGRYTRMRATANLRNWLGFMALRSAPTAQLEIRVYSNAIGQLVQETFPRTWELFAEGKSL